MKTNLLPENATAEIFRRVFHPTNGEWSPFADYFGFRHDWPEMETAKWLVLTGDALTGWAERNRCILAKPGQMLDFVRDVRRIARVGRFAISDGMEAALQRIAWVARVQWLIEHGGGNCAIILGGRCVPATKILDDGQQAVTKIGRHTYTAPSSAVFQSLRQARWARNRAKGAATMQAWLENKVAAQMVAIKRINAGIDINAEVWAAIKK